MGALTHVPTESKASVLHLETLSQQHWVDQTSKSITTLTQHHSQLELTPQPCCSGLPFRTQIQISHTSENTEWIFFEHSRHLFMCSNYPWCQGERNGLWIPLHHPACSWHSNAAGVLLHQAHTSRGGFKAPGFFQVKCEMEFPTAYYCHSIDG